MSPHQLTLDEIPAATSAVRRTDPASAKRAAAANPAGRATQAARILRYVWRNGGVITADVCYRQLGEGDDITRGEWSARLGVLSSTRRGLLVRCGEVPDVDRHGQWRSVQAYRLTSAGRDECARMFGGVS
jgi:hypothetical protein